ncbi:helix-turn-helix transcriptional regulator [Lentzea aerocolonigenes]|uniref:helix-turn-helix transcriptional regulator n=1 Tax=Lentzea aerocolonigenes TaxID=68170 RepID=UPI00191C3014|nr:helix-turn-helix transcriptional regulator [Lentzea aerocolonigenes]
MSDHAVAAYEAMLANPQHGVAEIADTLGISEAQVRDGLDELCSLSLVRQSWDEPGKLRAIPPRVGLTALLSRQESELKARQDQLNASRHALEHVIAEYTAFDEPQAGVEQLTGLDSARCRIETLAHECESEVLAFCPDGALTVDNMKASRALDEAVLSRGVKMRTIYLDSIVNDTASASYAEWLVGTGAEVRTVPISPPRMLIYDRRVAVVPIDPDNTAAGAVLLNGAGVVAALCDLFSYVWESAFPFGMASPCAGPDELTPQEMAVLRLLAEGHTDETVARKLGVSVRTSRRITANIAKRLGVRSRFQAGVEAVRRGWLRPTGE